MGKIAFNSVNEIKKTIRILFVGESATDTVPMAYSTSAGLSFSKDDIDTSNKMDGEWGTTLGGKKSAELSVDSFCAPSNTSGYTETKLYKAYDKDKALYFRYVYVNVTEGDDGGTEVEEDLTKPWYKGRLKISSLDLSSDNGDVCKYSTSATSQGKVTHVSIFSTADTYELDDHVMYDGTEYVCTTAVTTAGDWDASNWTAVSES